ncbi:hypothetical protein SAMN02745673_04764 [Marinactinospora thermotolerans DSM 45154]|uniref:Uncharacterized protein n=1 Tax=Marinactinospora thermotolerans DSM 45154 TaxID=1122192 RepID=A0A1T4TC38_9ACTN|nr:hypothetical protein [Marinactinospora thermotolerans]SKA37956.1 hypothetical protein SAMN02745673_04764 [Marinactinospora thermotolerans DSM 45154]
MSVTASPRPRRRPPLRPPLPDEVTPLLCATAFARPDRIRPVTDWLLAQGRACLERLTERLRRNNRLFRLLLLPERERELFSLRDEEEPDPDVLVGDAYARWVLRRIARSDRPLPVIGFDQDAVIASCETGARLGAVRRALLCSAALLAWGAAELDVLPTAGLLVVFPALLWGIFLFDRITAQRSMNRVLERAPSSLGGPGRTPPDESGVAALPYISDRGRRRFLEEDRFLGAGLEVWNPASISVDVTKGGPGVTPGETPHRDDAILALLGMMYGGGRRDPKGFTLTELYERVARDLEREIRFEDMPDDHLPVDVAGIWGTSAVSWERIDDPTWRSLPSVTDGVAPGDTAPDPRLLRPYLWARIKGWSGSLVVSVLVRFTRREEHLHVIVIPQVVAPLVDVVSRLRPVPLRHPLRLLLTALQAAGDVGALFAPLLRPRRRPRPEIDTGRGPVGLREAYSKRRVDDMHMKHDTRQYASLLQRRVFDSVERFLDEHDIDTGEYREATTNAIVNFGVMGSDQQFNGQVQITPFGDHNTQQQQGEGT